MKIQSLLVSRMPGIDTPFTLVANPGLNLIVGPNGSGKSTVCRSVMALLWPGRLKYSPLSLTCHWSQARATLLAEREGFELTRWQRDGSAWDPPDLPADHLAGSYRLGVLDLFKLQPDATDTSLAERIRTLMAGGFNVNAVIVDHFSIPGRWATRELEDFKQQGRYVHSLQSEQMDLAAQEDTLATKRIALDAARQAAGRLPLWREGEALADARDQRAAAAVHLDGFSAQLKQMLGDELDREAKLQLQLAAEQQDLSQCQQRLATADKELDQANLTAGPLAPATLETWRERVRGLADLQKDCLLAQQNTAAAHENLQEAKAALAWGWDTDQAPRIEAGTLRTAEDYLRRTHANTAQQQALSSLLRHEQLQEDDLGTDTTNLQLGIRSLENWLTATGPLPRNRWWLVATILSLIIAVLGGVFVATGMIFGWAIVVGGLAGAAATSWLGRSATEQVDLQEVRRTECVTSYRGTGLKPPAPWSVPAVRRRLVDLRQDLARCEVNRLKATVLSGLAAEQKTLAEKAAGLLEERQELQSEVGVAPDSPDSDLVEFAQRVHWYQNVLRDHKTATALSDQKAAALAEELARVDSFLAPYGYPESTDAAGAAAHLEDLIDRNRTYEDAQVQRDREITLATSLAEKAEALKQQYDQLFRRLDLEPADVAGLTRLLEKRPTYLQAVSDQDHRERRVEELEQRLSDHPDLLHMTRDEIATHFAEDHRLANEADGILVQINSIEQHVEDARSSQELAHAQQAMVIARERLGAKRDELLQRAAGRFLLTQLHARHEQRSQPAVLNRARQLLITFTHGNYQLLVEQPEGESARFRALETRSGRGLELTQLSDGTRAQLLLAARLAFLCEAESGVKLPIFLDESLTSSDPERFHAIASALLEMVKQEDRQLFYLTANPADLQAWQRAAELAGLEVPVHVDLAQLRGLPQQASAPELTMPPLPSVPPPAQLTAEQYGELLKVPRFDPRTEASATHLFHLWRDDLQLLHLLLLNRIETCGQWRALSRVMVATDRLDQSLADQVTARCEVVNVLTAAWRTGRGRQVNRQVLLDSSVIGDRYLDDIVDLALAQQGDSRALVSALHSRKIKGFAAKKTEALEEFLEREGYLDPRPVMSEDEVRRQVARALEPSLTRGALDMGTLMELIHQLWIAADRSDSERAGRESKIPS